MSNNLDPDQARRFVGPDLGPNCLQKLSTDDTSRQRVKRINECSIRHICGDVDKKFHYTLLRENQRNTYPHVVILLESVNFLHMYTHGQKLYARRMFK